MQKMRPLPKELRPYAQPMLKLLQLQNDGIVLWRHLTKVISILNYSKGPGTDRSRLGIEPRPLLWEVSTLAKSYSKSILKAIWNIHIWDCDDQCMWLHEHT